jgi:hypothetical protein
VALLNHSLPIERSKGIRTVCFAGTRIYSQLQRFLREGAAMHGNAMKI